MNVCLRETLIQTDVGQYSSLPNKTTSEEDEKRGGKGRGGGQLGMRNGEEEKTAHSRQEGGKLRQGT